MGAMKNLMIECQEALEAIRTGPDQFEQITEQAEALAALRVALEAYRVAANMSAPRPVGDLYDAVEDLFCALAHPPLRAAS